MKNLNPEYQVVLVSNDKWMFQGTITECEDYHQSSDMGDLEEILLFNESREQEIILPII